MRREQGGATPAQNAAAGMANRPAGGRRGRRNPNPLSADELERQRQSGLQKLREGRSREMTSLEAGAVGGSLVKDAFSALRERAAEHGHDVLTEIDELVHHDEEEERAAVEK